MFGVAFLAGADDVNKSCVWCRLLESAGGRAAVNAKCGGGGSARKLRRPIGARRQPLGESQTSLTANATLIARDASARTAVRRVAALEARGGLSADQVAAVLSEIQADSPEVLALLSGGDGDEDENGDAAALAEADAKFLEVGDRERNRNRACVCVCVWAV